MRGSYSVNGIGAGVTLIPADAPTVSDLCTPKDGDPFDVLDKYQDRDGDTLIFRSHRINLNVMRDVQISTYRRGEE